VGAGVGSTRSTHTTGTLTMNALFILGIFLFYIILTSPEAW